MTTEPRRLSIRLSWLRMLFAATVIVMAALVAYLWFLPIETGEFRTSPDGRFTAGASNVVRGTLRGRMAFVDLRVVEADTKQVVWKIEYDPPPNTAPDYGERQNDPFIVVPHHFSAPDFSVLLSSVCDPPFINFNR